MHVRILSAALVAVLASAAGTPAHAANGRGLDADGDGGIDRREAAASPRLATAFDRLDRDGDGRLDAGERRRSHAGKGRHRAGIERLDRDGDGRIDRAEFDAGRQARADRVAPAGDERRAGLRPDFDTLDRDRDGYVVRSEVEAWRLRTRPQRDADRTRRAGERFAAADLNRDGRLSRLEVEEAMPRLAARFAWLDEDRDGFLAPADLAHRRR